MTKTNSKERERNYHIYLVNATGFIPLVPKIDAVTIYTSILNRLMPM